MSHNKTVLAIALVGMLLIGGVAPAAAHDWQTSVTQGDMELGISSSPGTPVAGMQAEFSGRILDNGSVEGEENRLSWGGVTNKEVAVHINGPDGIHDHVTAEVPEDDAHFHFAYTFPEKGTYTITVVTTIEGDEYAFEFQREVRLLPARAEGETVENTNENVTELQNQVEKMDSQMDTLEQQNEDLQQDIQELKDAQSANDEGDTTNASAPGFGLVAALVALVAGVSYLAGRRD